METILRLDKCSGSVTNNLPDGMNVRGELWVNYLEESYTFHKFPKGLKVSKRLFLGYCKAINYIPDDLSVGGDIILYGCGINEELPENFKVGGSLELPSSYEPEYFITDGLKVGGNLYVGTKVGFIPNKVMIGGDLNIEHSHYLRYIADDIVVKGKIIADSATSMHIGKSGDLTGIIPKRFQNKIVWEDN